MIRVRRLVLFILIILNGLVFTGQVWPEGAPPFAAAVNITTLVLNMFYLVLRILTPPNR